MDDLITIDEIQTFRTPADFIRWFEAYLERTRVDRRYKSEILLRKGIAKEVYEEVYPLYRMLQFFGEEWKDCRFRNVLGDQSFDVEVTGDGKPPFQFIEITGADLNHEEHLRMQYLVEHGRVSAIGKVSCNGTEKTGQRISVSDDYCLREEVNQKKKLGIEEAITSKAKKDYPEATVLLVYFDDYVAFSDEDDQKEMEDFIESLGDHWESEFTELFIVGTSGRRGWRKRRPNKADELR